MADLDLLRDINNTYGHLAGDAVLKGIAEVFRAQLRHYDVPARFGGEEFSHPPARDAAGAGARDRRAHPPRRRRARRSRSRRRASRSARPSRSASPAFPQRRPGRERARSTRPTSPSTARSSRAATACSARATEPLLMPADRRSRASSPCRTTASRRTAARRRPSSRPGGRAPRAVRARTRVTGPRFFSLSARLALLVAVVSAGGIAAGVLGRLSARARTRSACSRSSRSSASAQALALEVDGHGTISRDAPSARSPAPPSFGPRAALALAVTIAIVDWSARRIALHQRPLQRRRAHARLARGRRHVFALRRRRHAETPVAIADGRASRARVYFARQHGPAHRSRSRSRATSAGGASCASASPGCCPHYVVYGFVAGVIAIAYHAGRALRARRLRGAAPPHAQDAGGLPARTREKRDAEAARGGRDDPDPERLARAGEPAAQGALDRRDGVAVGHGRRPRRVHRRPLAPRAAARARDRRELGSRRPSSSCSATRRSSTTSASSRSRTRSCSSRRRSRGDEWALMQRHADEGARIIDRLGFLERRRAGDPAPPRALGRHAATPTGCRARRSRSARGSSTSPTRSTRCSTTRIYRAARPAAEALGELRRAAGKQFCPRCVAALERILAPSGRARRDAQHEPCSRPPRVVALERAPPRLARCEPACSIHSCVARKPSYRGRRRRSTRTSSRRSRPGSASATPTSRSSTSCAPAPSGSAARRRCGSSPPTRRRRCTRRR